MSIATKIVPARKALIASILAAFVAVFTCSQPAEAANYPLELTNISSVGVNGMSANNRIFRAYPGLVYNIRPAVVGGLYPYTFSLQNAPSGMTISAATGEITWLNPQADATPTIVIRDSEGATLSRAWTITVSATGFRFVDAVNGRNAPNNGCSSSCGSGTFANPWRNLADLLLNDASADITYFRAGTYNVQEVPASQRQSIGSVWERIVVTDNSGSSFAGSVIWLGYPGERPLLDFTCTSCTSGLMIRHTGQSVYIDGFETRDSAIIAFQFEPTGAQRGPTYRKLNMHHHGPGGDGTNAAFIMTVSSYPQAAYGMVVQDSTFTDVTSTDPDDAVTLKLYSQIKPLIENTIHANAVTAIELKADVRQFTVRSNVLYNLTGTAIGGNMHACVGCGAGGADMPTTRGEILFNSVRVSGAMAKALRLNQDGQALEIYAYRNTFFGRVEAQSVDAADGPFFLTRNVIINTDSGTPANSHVVHTSVSAPARIVLTENLAGYPTDNIIDANNNLTAAYNSYFGTRGYQRAGGPQQVTGVRVTTP
jgi:hypothetical protein